MARSHLRCSHADPFRRRRLTDDVTIDDVRLGLGHLSLITLSLGHVTWALTNQPQRRDAARRHLPLPPFSRGAWSIGAFLVRLGKEGSEVL